MWNIIILFINIFFQFFRVRRLCFEHRYLFVDEIDRYLNYTGAYVLRCVTSEGGRCVFMLPLLILGKLNKK